MSSADVVSITESVVLALILWWMGLLYCAVALKEACHCLKQAGYASIRTHTDAHARTHTSTHTRSSTLTYTIPASGTKQVNVPLCSSWFP